MKFRRSILGYVSAAALGAALLFSSRSSSADDAKKPASLVREHVVKIVGMEFIPKVVHISAGEAVTWVNTDIVPHGVKAKPDAKGWDSGLLQPKQSWTHLITEGTGYFCPYHPTMEGSVVIDPPSS